MDLHVATHTNKQISKHLCDAKNAQGLRNILERLLDRNPDTRASLFGMYVNDLKHTCPFMHPFVHLCVSEFAISNN